MTRFRPIRTALTVPVALALAFGGALFAVSPAVGAPGDPVLITAPQTGAAGVPRVLDVRGTGSDGATVALSDGAGEPLGQTITVPQGGAWIIPISFRDSAPAAQTIIATQTIGRGDVTSASVTVTLADPVQVVPQPLLVGSPADGAAIDSRFVDVEGTATPGASITVNVGTTTFGLGTANVDGFYAIRAYFPFGLVPEQPTVTVAAVNTDGTSAEPVDLQLTLLAPIATPTIDSPATGSTIEGGILTVRGTGVPGQSVVVAIVPDIATAAANPDIPDAALSPSAIVGDDGRFEVTTELPFGTYRALAVHTETPVDALDSELLSLRSAEVTFTLVPAAAAQPPPAPVPAGPTGELAATGATSIGLVGPAVALLLGGLVLLVASRRRMGRAGA